MRARGRVKAGRMIRLQGLAGVQRLWSPCRAPAGTSCRAAWSSCRACSGGQGKPWEPPAHWDKMAEMKRKREQEREEFRRREEVREAAVDFSRLSASDAAIVAAHRTAVQGGHFTYDDPATGTRGSLLGSLI